MATLVLLGLILAGIAAGIGGTWIDDGDGTCGALYKPNLSRIGCTSKLMPAALAAGVLVGGALLAWDAARHPHHRPSRGATIFVAISLVTVFALLVVRSGTDGGAASVHDPGVLPAPTTPPQVPQAPLSVPGLTPLSVPPQ